MNAPCFARRAMTLSCALAMVAAGAASACSSSDDGGSNPTKPGSDAGGTPDSATPGTDGGADTGTDASDPDELSAAELAAFAKMSPLPVVPADTTNKYADNAAAAALGQMLFFDKSYSGAITLDGAA